MEVNLEPVLSEYYAVRGWDRNTGHTTLEKLKELSLEPVDQ